MKKTIITLATVTAATVAPAADVLPTLITTINPDDFSATLTQGSKATLSTPLNLANEQWSITTAFTVDKNTAFNAWGTTILCTTEALYENTYNGSDVQIWLSADGSRLNVKGMGFNSASTDRGIGSLSLTSGSTYTVTITANKNAIGNYDMSLTLSDAQGSILGQLGNEEGKTVTFSEGAALTYVTTSIGAGNTGSSSVWVKPTITFRTPEPATATMSLLALAGLAARRRRK